MTKRQQQERTARRQFKNHGWDVPKTDSIEFNSGSETVKHCIAKTLAAHAGKQAGYRVASEVAHSGERGEIDVLLYAHPERLTLAVEAEVSPTDDVVQDKVERYVHNTPVDDLALLNVNSLSSDYLDAYGEVKEVLGL